MTQNNLRSRFRIGQEKGLEQSNLSPRIALVAPVQFCFIKGKEDGIDRELRKMKKWAKLVDLPTDICKWCDQDFVEYEKERR